jgi:hypothetical protein
MSYLLTAFRNAGGLGGNADGLGGANHPTGKAPVSRPAYTPSYKPAPTSTKTVAQIEQEERDRKKAAVAEANTPKSVEDRHKELLKNMYGSYNGEFGGRVLTDDEIHNGWVDANGNYRQGTPRETRSDEELAEIRHRNLSHDWYSKGMDHFTASREIGPNDFGGNIHHYGNGDVFDEALGYVRDVFGVPDGQGVMGPWVSTYDHDRVDTYNYVKDSDYNAFLGSFGNKQSGVDGYRDDSIAGYFKNAFAGQDQIKNRSDALRDLKQWNANEGAGAGRNKATDVMTRQYFEQMDLANKYGLTWEQAGAVANQNQGAGTNQNQGAGTNQNYNESGGSPVDPGTPHVADNDPNSGFWDLSHQDSGWLDVLRRGGANNWDSLLGQYTYGTPLDWGSMDSETVESQFSDLFDSGGMFTQGKNRDLIYAKLMENMGRV